MNQPIELFITGACAEGQGYCRQLGGNDIGPDIDCMFTLGTLNSEDELISVEKCPLFVRVKWNNTSLASLPHSDDKQYVNAFKMKQNYSKFVKNNFQNQLFRTQSIVETSSQSAAVKMRVGGIRENFDQNSYSQSFKEALDTIKENRKDINFMITLKENFRIYYQYSLDSDDILGPIWHDVYAPDRPELSENNISIHLTTPAFNIPLAFDYKQKIRALIQFYKKHKHLSHPNLLSNTFEIINSIPELDFDLVPALELKFWPKNIKPFLNRLRQNRPDLYDKICKTRMHLVTKASPISSDNNKEFDFRYSFSAIELILAEGRTRNEKLLNSVAKSIYYKYLYKKTASQEDKEQYIPSYFVKTTIFWMCEQKHYELNKIDGTNDEEIEKKLALEWIQYTSKLLWNGVVKHYFLEEVNILDSYPIDSVTIAWDILKNGIDLDNRAFISATEKVRDGLLKLKCEQYVEHQRFKKNLSIIDIKQARDDFLQLKEQWFPDAIKFDSCDVLDVLNDIALFDDNGNDDDTWSTWEVLICDYDNLEISPLSYEISNCDPASLAYELCESAFILKNIIDLVSNVDYINEIRLFNKEEFKKYIPSYYNNLNLMKLVSQNHITEDSISKMLLLMQPTAAENYLSVEKRSVLQAHPDGPQPLQSSQLMWRNIFTDLTDTLKKKCNYTCSIDYLTMFNDNRQPIQEEITAKYLEIAFDAIQYMSLETFSNAIKPQLHTPVMPTGIPPLPETFELSEATCQLIAGKAIIKSFMELHSERMLFDLIDLVDNLKTKCNYISPIDYSSRFNHKLQMTYDEYTEVYSEITFDAMQHIPYDILFNAIMSKNDILKHNMMKSQSTTRDLKTENLSNPPIISSSRKLYYLSVPRDHSCCFTSLYFLLVSSTDYEFLSNQAYRAIRVQELRDTIAQIIEEDPNRYTDVILDKSPIDYCQWLRRSDSWGGDIELSICSILYSVEICVINLHLQSPNAVIIRIGENFQSPTRIFLTYDGTHYNPVFTLIDNKINTHVQCDDIEIMKLAQNKRIEDFSSFKNDEQQSTLVKNRKIHSNRSQFDNFQSQVLANILVDFVDNIKQKYNYISPIDYLTMFNDNRKPTFEEYVSKYMEIQIDALQHISVEQYLNVVISQQHISDISLMNTAQQKSYDRLSIFRKLVTTNENRLSNNDVQQQSNKEETRSISSSLSSSPSTASSVRTQPSIKTSNLPEDNTYELLLQQCSKRFQCRVKKKPVTFSTIDQLHYCTKPYQEKPVNAWMGWDVMLFFKEKNLLDMALLFLNADGNELIEVFNSCETNGLKMYDYLNEELQNNYFTTLSIIEYHRFVSELRKYIQLLPLRPVVKNAKTCTIF